MDKHQLLKECNLGMHSHDDIDNIMEKYNFSEEDKQFVLNGIKKRPTKNQKIIQFCSQLRFGY